MGGLYTLQMSFCILCKTLLTFCVAIFEKLRALFFGITKPDFAIEVCSWKPFLKNVLYS